MKRIEAIEMIVKNVTDEIIISSTGMISRELHQVCDRERNFYMQGSMGCALAIGLGMAMSSDNKIIVISGDGAVLMSLGSLVLHKKLKPPNLEHYILDNNCHSSTGGQLTCSDEIDFSSLAPNTKVIKISNEKGNAARINLSPKEIKERFMKAVSQKGQNINVFAINNL
jgi:sulfopyruvate decarboxylase subunit beta